MAFSLLQLVPQTLVSRSLLVPIIPKGMFSNLRQAWRPKSNRLKNSQINSLHLKCRALKISKARHRRLTAEFPWILLLIQILYKEITSVSRTVTESCLPLGISKPLLMICWRLTIWTNSYRNIYMEDQTLIHLFRQLQHLFQICLTCLTFCQIWVI